MTHLEFPICSRLQSAHGFSRFTFAKLEATPSSMMAPWIDKERSNSRILRHRQLTCFNLPSSNCTSVGIPGLWWTSLDVAGKLAGWRKSVQFAVGSFQERPIQAHTYIELDWRGGTSSSVPVYMAVSKNCIQVSYVLVIMPATDVDPTNTSTGQKRRAWKKTAETNKRARRGV